MRIAYLDNVRALAIIAVVWIHLWDSFIIPSNFVHSLFGWSLFQCFHIIGRLGVPLFVMLTGALMLGREYPDVTGFIKAKLSRFLGSMLVASVVYACLVHSLFNEDLKGRVIRFLTGNPVGAYHLWYMYMLIGLYISLPFLAKLLSVLKEREIKALIVFSIILVMMPWTLTTGNAEFSYYTSYSFIIQTWTLYAITGFWLYKHEGLKGYSLNLRAFCLVLAVAISTAIKVMLDYHSGGAVPADGVTWYDSLYIFIPSVLLFSIIRDYPAGQKGYALAGLISAASYSIYLWHLVIVHCAVYLNGKHLISPVFLFIAASAVAVCFGIAIYKPLYRSKINWLVRG